MALTLRPSARVPETTHPLLPWLSAHRDIAAGIAGGRVPPADGADPLAPVAAVGIASAYEAVYLRTGRYLAQLATPLAPGTVLHAVYLAADRALDDSTNLNIACETREEFARIVGTQEHGAYALACYRTTLKDVMHTAIAYDHSGVLPAVDADRLAAARGAPATGVPSAAEVSGASEASDADLPPRAARRVVAASNDDSVRVVGGRRTLLVD